MSVCSCVCTCIYVGTMYTESTEPSKADLGTGSGRKHLKSLKAPGAEAASGEGHTMVRAECQT